MPKVTKQRQDENEETSPPSPLTQEEFDKDEDPQASYLTEKRNGRCFSDRKNPGRYRPHCP